MASPCAVFMSASHRCPRDFMQYIFKGRELPEFSSEEVTEPLEKIPFHLENKYYSASVDLCLAHRKDLVGAEFAEAVEAVVLHFNNLASDGLDKAAEWLSFIRAWEPSVQILACDTLSEEAETSGVSRVAAQEWCIEHGFELVELAPEPDEDDDDDEPGAPFGASRGPDRILAALNAHTWSNLVLKDEKCDKPAAASGLAADSASKPTPGEPEAEPSEAEGAAFEELFQNFADMKTTCEAMTPESRRKYAEKITIAFWKAMNGDGDEIADLDSDDSS